MYVVKHPDGYVKIKNTAQEYLDTESNFATDYGQSFPVVAGTEGWPLILFEPDRGGLFVANERVREFVRDFDPALQAIIDSFSVILANKEARENPIPTIEEMRQILINRLKLEGLTRIQTVLPGISSIDDFDVIAEIWKSIAPAARQPTTDLQNVIDIYAAAKAAVAVINSFTTEAEITAYDVVSDPSWPLL